MKSACLKEKYWLAALISVFLVACVPAREVVKTADGTGDSGGGNTFKGRPLESYLRSPEADSAFVSVLLPIREHLSSQGCKLAVRLFDFVLREKPWYFVPSDLGELPQKTIGSVVPTEQAALQGLGQVWINSEIFDAMSESDRARLILHEVLMGIRLLDFDSYQRECEIEYGEDFCVSEPKHFRGKPSDLQPSDYDAIRRGVALLLSDFRTITSDQAWRKFLGDVGFKSYRERPEKMVEISDIAQWLQTSKITGTKLRYGFDMESFLSQYPEFRRKPYPVPSGRRYAWKPKETCSFDFQFEAPANKLTVEIQTGARKVKAVAWGGDQSSVRLQYYDYPYAPSGDVEYWHMSFNQDRDEMSRMKLGQRSFSGAAYFESQRLVSVGIREIACVSEDSGFGCNSWRSVDEGIDYLCSTEPSLTFQW